MNPIRRPPLWMRVLPRRFVSRLFGLLAAVPIPPLLRRPVYGIYSRRYGVAREEMELPFRGYRAFRDFFSRRLLEGLRPQPADPLAVASPADGRTAAAGHIADGTMIQAKGLVYSVSDLLGDAEAGARFEGGTYHVVYLAPGDYHRFHVPCDWAVHAVRHLPGDLWPVNDTAVARVPRLFARNERVVVEAVAANGGAVAFVAVGALNVGSIHLAFHKVRTNRTFQKQPRTWRADPPAALADARRGDELGWFTLGSTVVLLVSSQAGVLHEREAGLAIRCGTPIGLLQP